jgi:hypothetical protein
MIHRSRTVVGSSRERWVFALLASSTNGRKAPPRQEPRRRPLRLRMPLSASRTLPSSKPTYRPDPTPPHERNVGSTKLSSIRPLSRDASRRVSASAPACRSTRACPPTPARAAMLASRHSASSVTRPACGPETPRLLPNYDLCPSMNPSRTSICAAR